MSQYSLAAALDIERNSVYRWANEKRDPSAETVVEIVRALKSMNPQAAEDFVNLYLGNEINPTFAVLEPAIRTKNGNRSFVCAVTRPG